MMSGSHGFQKELKGCKGMDSNGGGVLGDLPWRVCREGFSKEVTCELSPEGENRYRVQRG